MRGSLSLLFVMTLVYLLTTLGLGLFVSTISSTQQQAMMTTVFFFLMPMVLLSGFVFPIENMPWFFELLSRLDPIRYMLVVARGAFLQDMSVGVALHEIWPMAAIAAALLGIATVSVRRAVTQ